MNQTTRPWGFDPVVPADDVRASVTVDVGLDVDVLEDCTCTDVFTPRREDWLSGSDVYLRRR